MMRCANRYQNDRTCDLCQIVNKSVHDKCLEIYNNDIEHNKRIRKILKKCIHRTKCWDEYTPFTGCNKNGKGHGRHAEDCDPTIECEQYCDGQSR